MIYEPMVRLAQTVHLSCTDSDTVSKQTKAGFHMAHVTLEHHRVGPISEPMVRSAQTMHLSCVKISTTFKRTKVSIH
jgi:hypothetical protein